MRLAVLAADSSAATATLADLLTVQLAQTPGVETVERAEIERVQGEADRRGLVEASTECNLGVSSCCRTGLRATEAGGDRILIRLVETRGGFVAGFSTWRQAAIAGGCHRGRARHLPKRGSTCRGRLPSVCCASLALLPSDARIPWARFRRS